MTDLVLQRYFARLDAGFIDEALAVFHDDAVFTIYPKGDQFKGKDAIKAMFLRVFQRHGAVDRRVRDIAIDEERCIVAASFEARFRTIDGVDMIMQNVNFWQIHEGKFVSVRVYTSDPGFASELRAHSVGSA
jgi:ketosteroid isomerase-like protein